MPHLLLTRILSAEAEVMVHPSPSHDHPPPRCNSRGFRKRRETEALPREPDVCWGLKDLWVLDCFGSHIYISEFLDLVFILGIFLDHVCAMVF